MKVLRKISFVFIILMIMSILAQAQSILNLRNLSSDEYYRLARIEGNQKGNFSMAAKYCKKGLEQAPDNMDLRQYLGKCYLELKNYDSARYELKKVVDKYPHNVDARHYLVNVEYQTGRYSSAICYVNELLEQRPYSKTLWLKKIAIYNDMGNKVESKRALTRLYGIFPEDSTIKTFYKNMMIEEADKSAKYGDYQTTKELYSEVLSVNPRDLQTIQKQVNNELKAGKKVAALELIETGLSSYPYDPILVNKKIGLLQEMRMFPEAISYIESLLKKYPSATLKSTLTDLKLESARYYNNTDPYVLYQKVYDSNPGNEEAFNYLLNNALSKGYYEDAGEYLNKALKRSPGNKTLMLKQMTLYEMQNKTTEANKMLEKLATKFPSDADIRDKYYTLLLQQGKDYFQDQLYEKALPIFEKLTGNSATSSVAADYIYATYVAQKNYPQALNQINKLISRSPREEEYKFKKSALLEEMGKLDEAREITNSLSKQNPSNTRYKDVFISQSLPLIKKNIEDDKFENALETVESVLESDPSNLQALNYGINSNATIKDYDAAIAFCDRALGFYPDSKDIKLKKAGLYAEKKDHENAISTLSELHTNYPYSDKITSSLSEELFLKGRQFEKNSQIDSAFAMYQKAYELNPKDTSPIYRIVNIELESGAYEIANFYINEGLSKNPENTTLLYKKGVLFEKTEQYDSAYHYLKLAEPLYGYNKNYQDYMDFLYSKKFKNRIGINFVRSFYDSTQLKSAIATLEYSRFGKINNYTVRFNYAARPTGTGVQNEIEWFHKFNKEYYTQANIAIANQHVFPKFKISGSVFKNLNKDYEGELGARYVLQRDNVGLFSLVGGVAKTWEDVWVNARGFVMTDSRHVYQTLLLQSRYYFNYKNDYISIMGSLGTPPEDKTLDFQLNTFLTYVTRMVGAGYQHKVKHRTTIGLQGNWFNFRIKEDYNVNQYNLFITLLTMF